ncbi:hypothetical protein [Salinivibrio sp. IB643]|nr:hypothetical protein [Salinivibrio sp. IB643]
MQKQVISTARVMGLIGALLVTSTAVHANNTMVHLSGQALLVRHVQMLS